MWLFSEIALLLLIPWIFWPVLVLASAWLVWCVVDDENTRPSATIWPLIAISALLYLMGWYPMLSWQQWALAAAVYLPIGSGYSIFRWKMFVRTEVRRALDKVDDLRAVYAKNVRYQTGTQTFEEWVTDKRGGFMDPPQASHNKGRIYIWILYWPISAVCYVMRDMVTHLMREIYARLSRIYDRITASEWSKVNAEVQRTDKSGTSV